MKRTTEKPGRGTTDGVRLVIAVRLTSAGKTALRELTKKYGLLNDQETIRYLIAKESGWL